MPKPVGSQLDLRRLPVIGLVPESGASAPTNPVNGQLWVDPGTGTGGKLRWFRSYDSTWVAADGSSIPAGAVGTSQLADNSVTDGKLAGSISLSKLATDPLNRANHTGTQLAATISNLAATVQSYRLDQFAAPTALLNFNGQRITSLGAPVASTDAARLLDVQNAQAGIDNKPSVRAATTANITLSGTQTIDGVAIADGDRVLVKNQTTPANNGLYLASASAWSRTGDTLNPNSFVFVEEGTTQGDTGWMISTDGAITVGTTALTWTQFGAATSYTAGTGLTLAGTVFSLTTPVSVANGGTGATTAAGARANLGATTKYAADLPAISAGATSTITHGLGTTDVQTLFKETATGEEVLLSWKTASATTITVTPDLAYAAGALRVVIIG